MNKNNINQKVALVAVINKDFLVGAKVMIYSFLKYNTWFKGDIILFMEEEIKGVKSLFSFFSNIKIQPISPQLIEQVEIFRRDYPQYCKKQAAYYMLDIFQLSGYSRILFVDSDVLFKNSVKHLFEIHSPLAAVLDKMSYHGWCRNAHHFRKIEKNPSLLAKEEKIENTFNSGILSISNALLTPKVYSDLFNMIDGKIFKRLKAIHNDQFILNIYFQNKCKTLSGIYNYRMQIGQLMQQTDGFSFSDVRVLHFTGKVKPWHFFKAIPKVFKNREYGIAFFHWWWINLLAHRRNFQLNNQARWNNALLYLKSLFPIQSYASVETYCIFIGYARSGHSLVGALLDAHPNAIIAHELDVFDLKKKSFSKRQIFNLTKKRSIEMTKNGYIWTGYHYQVPHQYQGKHRELKVMGVKHGGKLGKLLQENPRLLNDFKDFAPKLKLIHVNRNPFDIITTRIHRRQEKRKRLLTKAEIIEQIEFQFKQIEVVKTLKSNSQLTIFDLSNEELISQPTETLFKLCEYLGLPPHEDYLKDCASIIFKKPTATRHRVKWWDDELKAMVNEKIQAYDFLQHYRFEEDSVNELNKTST